MTQGSALGCFSIGPYAKFNPPRYDPMCFYDAFGNGYNYFLGNQTLRQVITPENRNDLPFKAVARVITSAGNNATATLIRRGISTLYGGPPDPLITVRGSPRPADDAPRASFFLTAAHAVIDAAGKFIPQIQVLHAFNSPDQPYAPVMAYRVWVPVEYLTGGGNASQDAWVRAFDYAILECPDLTPNLPVAPASSATLTNTTFTDIFSIPAVTLGYACGRGPDVVDANDQLVATGPCRVSGMQYYTDPAPPPPANPPVAMYYAMSEVFVGGKLKGAVLVSNVEGTSGMSGGPMLVGKSKVIGVLTGTPCICGDITATVNWSAAITPHTHERILSCILLGHHVDMSKNL